MSMFNGVVSVLRQMITKTPAIQSVRYRYHSEKEANRPVKRYGFSDNLDRRGLLPHVATETRKLPMNYRYVLCGSGSTE